MKKLIIVLCLFLGSYTFLSAQHKLKSPNGKIIVSVDVSNGIHYSVSLNDQIFVERSDIGLSFNEIDLCKNTKLKKSSFTRQDKIETPVVALKESSIRNNYNQLSLDFKNNLTLEFRAFDDGVAYRFVTNRKGNVEVNETAKIEFADNYKMWASSLDGYAGSYEPDYQKVKINDFSTSKNTFLPLLIEHSKGYKMLMTEADVSDYPHMFLKKTGVNTLSATFPSYPLETKLIGDRGSEIVKGADHIAKTTGKRSFPWRLMVISEKDAQLMESNLVYLLAPENKLENTDWIKPGRVAWDWWNASNLYGVDFKAGLNTDTYKYFIDFAGRNGLEYVILDEGWSVSTTDITKPNPKLDLFELIRYGKEKNVKLILWASWRAIEDQFFVLRKYKEWGIAGIKVDFMNRADQWMVNYYEKVAKEAAQNELLVDFHGAFKPNGLHRAYPNVVSYEGVQGNEHCKWSANVTPEHMLTLPFTRMVCGPMDFTPGAMRNFNSKEFKFNFYRPGSQGTRCHQLALFIAYESGIQMLADSPSNYEREQESTDFLASVPNTWDELKVLEAKVGEYLVIARRKGDQWFIGAMNDNETEREFTIDLSFLSSGAKKAIIMQDGLNANRFAEDYQRIEKSVSNQSKLTVKMVKGGGFAARIK
ncbi:glycoside hydrolase family 97 protein [Labilibaculum euxinus]